MSSGLAELAQKQRRLIAALKQARQDAGFSGNKLAESLGWSQTKVSKIERGASRPSPLTVKQWLEKCNVRSSERDELIALSDELQTETKSYNHLLRDGFSRRQNYYGELEKKAHTIQIYQPSVIPGILQTRDYMERVFILNNALRERNIPKAIESRLRRQSIILDSAKNFEFIITESALSWLPGDSSILVEQLDRILSLAYLSNIHIYIISQSSQTLLPPGNAFIIFSTPDESPFVMVETRTNESIVTQTADVAIYCKAFEMYKKSSLTDLDCQHYLEKIKQKIKQKIKHY